MRHFIRGWSLVVAAGLAAGCSDAADPGTAASTTRAAADGCVMRARGVDVLRVAAPAEFKCAAADGSLHFTAPHYEVEFWLVPGAKTVDEAVGRVGTQIVGEFKDFKADRTTDLTVAGSPAKRLVGTGHEADDGDDGGADVIVFQVGGRVFVACNHDEVLKPAGQQGLLTLVQAARVP